LGLIESIEPYVVDENDRYHTQCYYHKALELNDGEEFYHTLIDMEDLQ